MIHNSRKNRKLVNTDFTTMGRLDDDMPVASSTQRKFLFGWWAIIGVITFIGCASATAALLMSRTYFYESGPSKDVAPVIARVGEDVFKIPQNVIRKQRQRLGGVQKRLDLLVQWPSMTGYSDDREIQFNNPKAINGLVFISVLPRESAPSTTHLYRNIYTGFIEKQDRRGPNGLNAWNFHTGFGYDGEVLYAQRGEPEAPFAIRCFIDTVPHVAASCIRDIYYGNSVLVRYRYSRAMLREWYSIEAAVRQTLDTYARLALAEAP